MKNQNKSIAEILARKIRRAEGNLSALERQERAATRLYDAGLLTPKELAQLDGMIMLRIASL